MIDTPVWVFDVDDTLYLERDYARSGFLAVDNHLESVYGVPGLADACWRAFEAGVRGDIFDQVLTSLDTHVPKSLIEELVEVYRQHTPSISLSEDVHAWLQHLCETRTLAVVTGGLPGPQQLKVRALGLERFTDIIVYSGSLGPTRDKPDPWSWKRVQDMTGRPSGDYIYFGDNPRKDFAAPISLGWNVVRVRLAGAEHSSIPTPAGVLEVTSIPVGQPSDLTYG